MAGGGDRPILPWRVVVGVLLHIIIPAYLLCALAAGLVPPRPAGLSDLLARMILTAEYFLPAYALLTVTAAATARAVDPWLHRRRAARRARDPQAVVEQSRARLAGAMTSLRLLPQDGRFAAAMTTLAHLPLDHADPRAQDLSRDLEAAGTAFVNAFRSAPETRRGEVLDLAADSVERIAAAIGTLAAERGRLDEGDARTIAGYIATRYADAQPLSVAPTARSPHS